MIGTLVTGKPMLLLKGSAVAACQLDLLAAVGASEPRVTRQDLSREARNWYFNVKSDFK